LQKYPRNLKTKTAFRRAGIILPAWRAISVKRKAPGEKHSAVEYADAFLFPEQYARTVQPTKSSKS
jgi:hypothetical protein